MTAQLRAVDVANALDWLPAHRAEGPVVASLPDMEALGMEPGDWIQWFMLAAQTCASASSGPTVFAQVDRKREGRWLPKDSILIEALSPRPLLWHRIALRRRVGQIDIHRPTYMHLLAFGPGRPGKPRPDVIDGGPQLWAEGMPIHAAMHIAAWLDEVAPQGPLINPFCGQGTLLAAANLLGRPALGCELAPDRATVARATTLPPDYRQ